MSKRTRIFGGAMLVVAAAAMGHWLLRDGEASGGTAPDGVMVIKPSAPAASTPPVAAKAPGAARLPALPERVVTDVRREYPWLHDVDFRCDGGGCQVLATIPPPTGDAFLEQRQAMLLGRLAKLVEADGYRMLGPPELEEVDDNIFHLRAKTVPVPDAAR